MKATEFTMMLREWRARCGWSDARAAMELGCAYGTLRHWLAGRAGPDYFAMCAVERQMREGHDPLTDVRMNAPEFAGALKGWRVRHGFTQREAGEAAETALNVLETLVSSAVKQLAQDILQDIFSEITQAHYGNPGINAVAPANFDYKRILAVREACAAVKMPTTDRALVLDSAYFTNLLGDDIVAKSYMPPIAQPGVVEGLIRRLAGFDIYETVILPENGEKLAGFAAHPSCLAVAMRYLEPVANYDEAGAVTDPDTGLTFGYLRYTEIQSNRIFVTVECLCGFNVAIAAGLQRIMKP